MKISIGSAAVAAVVVGVLGLAGCNRGGSNGQAADSGGGSTPSSAAASADSRFSSGDGGSGGSYAEAADRAPVPLFHGEPMWSENRRHTAKENAEYHFERAGQDLGAKTLDEFLTKVHHFGDHPPPGTLTMTRANGDRLLFDPKSDLFAVFTRQGAPRTVFKPSNGMDYWREQKTREAQGGGYGRGGYGGSGGGYGGGGDRGSGGGEGSGGGDAGV